MTPQTHTSLWDASRWNMASVLISPAPRPPDLKFRGKGTSWLLSYGILMFDLVCVPYTLAWNVSGMEWYVALTGMFWAVDMVRTFFTATRTYEDGTLNFNVRHIAWMYLRGWFVFDVALVVSDAVSVAIIVTSPDSTSAATYLRMLRIAKVTRLARIFRVMRRSSMAQTVGDWVDLHLPRGAQALLKVFFILSVSLIFGHLVTCAWYAIGSLRVCVQWFVLSVGVVAPV